MRDATTQLRRLGYINQDKQAVTSLPTPKNQHSCGVRVVGNVQIFSHASAGHVKNNSNKTSIIQLRVGKIEIATHLREQPGCRKSPNLSSQFLLVKTWKTKIHI